MKKCGWDSTKQSFDDKLPGTYDLYGSWALNFGSESVESDSEIGSLTTAVVPLPNASFFHIGTGNDMVESLYELQNVESDQTKLGAVPTLAQPRQFVQNCIFEAPLRRAANHSLWAENSHITGNWKIASENILTGVPANDWDIELEDGVCLDFVPVESGTAIRVYGFNDGFRGELGQETTKWINRPFSKWLEKRNITLDEANLEPDCDLQVAPLFPSVDKVDPEFVKWMFAEEPTGDLDQWKTLWLSSERVSARQLGQQADLRKIYESRNSLRTTALPVMATRPERSVFYKLDLDVTAKLLSLIHISEPTRPY